MLGNHVLNQDIAPGGCDSRHVSPGLDLVGDDGIGTSPQGVDPPDLDGIRARAGDPRPHGIQEVGQIHNVGLLRGGFDDGLSGNQGGRQHNVHGGAYACHVQADASAPQAFLAGLQAHILLGFVHHRSQSLKALDVLVNGTGGEVAAAGQRHSGLAEPAEQGSHQVVAGSHPPNQLAVGLGAGDAGAVNLHHAGLRMLHLCAHALQNVQ